MADWSEESIRRINDAVRWVEAQRGGSRHGPSGRRNSPTMPVLVRGTLDQTLAADEDGTLTTGTGLQLQCTNVSGATVTDGTAVWAFWSWDHSSYMILPAGEGGEAPHIYGELDEELEAGMSATMSVHDAEGDTGENVTLVDNLMPDGSSFPAGTFVWASWHEGDGQWYLAAAKSCPAGGPEGGGGVTDHGQLSGLGDDDHPHYALANGTRWTTTQNGERVAVSDASGNLVESDITTTELAALDGIEGNIEDRLDALEAGGGTGGFTANRVIISDGSGDLAASSITTTELDYLDGVSSNIQTQLDGKAADSHTHAISDVTGLSAALAGKADSVHSHAISDVTGLSTALAGKADANHTHDIEDIDGLEDALDGKAAAEHDHAIADVSGLQTALDGKAAATHGHAIADVTGLQTALDNIDAALVVALTKAVDTVTTSGSLTTANRTVLANNSAAITLDLPAAASMAGDYMIVKKVSDNAHTVTLDGHGSETIDGAASYVLYVVGDYVILQSDGTSWRVVGGYLAPHSVHLARSTAQNIVDGVRTRVAFDLAVDDVGGLADLTNGRAVVKRAGKYIVIASYMWWYPPATATNVQAFGYINSVDTLASVLYTGTFAAVRTKIADPINLAAGDVVDLYLLQASGADRSSRTETSNRPTLHLIEVR